MRFMKCFAAAAFAFLLFTVPVSAEEIEIELHNVISESVVQVDFDSIEPMKIENSTVVPLRKFCESAGLEVSWSDTEKTAYVKLDAKADSDLPIERYAYNIMQNTNKKGMALVPENIIITMGVNEQSIKLRYNYKNVLDEPVTMGKNIDTVVAPTVVSSGSIVVPIRCLMEAFGLLVSWNDNTVTVSVPPFCVGASNMTFVDVQEFPEDYEATDVWYGVVDEPEKAIPDGAVFIGTFRISHYCACSKCCGKWGNATAWAGAIVPGYTIAVDPKVIPKLSTVYIDGYGVRRAEDCGGAIKGNRIDVAVTSHSEALKLGIAYKDVWILP